MSQYDISRLIEDLAALGIYPPQAPSPGLPPGGVAGNLISKNSATDGDASWKTPDDAGVVAKSGDQLITGRKRFQMVEVEGVSPSSGFLRISGDSAILRGTSGTIGIITTSQSISLSQLYSDLWVDCTAGDIVITVSGGGQAINGETLFHRLDDSPNTLTIVRGTGSNSPFEGTLVAGPHEILMLKGYGSLGLDKYIGRILAHP